jgi:DNA replication protein DnaC
MADVLDACKRYAAEFSRESPSLLMLGKTGLGKTHLSLAICSALAEKGFGVVYTPVQKLTDRLEAVKFSYSDAAKEQYAAELENATGCDLLVLDDLGAEFVTQFSSAALYNIVNTRMAENRPTIISTNLEPQELEQKYSQRMSSRLLGGCHALRFTGRDIRFEKKFRG